MSKTKKMTTINHWKNSGWTRSNDQSPVPRSQNAYCEEQKKRLQQSDKHKN